MGGGVGWEGVEGEEIVNIWILTSETTKQQQKPRVLTSHYFLTLKRLRI